MLMLQKTNIYLKGRGKYKWWFHGKIVKVEIYLDDNKPFWYNRWNKNFWHGDKNYDNDNVLKITIDSTHPEEIKPINATYKTNIAEKYSTNITNDD